MTGYVLAVTAIDDEAVASALAVGLVEERLAACVQISAPVRSVYRWQGEIHDTTERQLWIKTTAAHVEALTAWLAERHPYEVPEVVVLDVADGLPAYLAWIAAETAAEPD